MSANAPVWPGPALVVPMTVDCLLVGQPDSLNAPWAQTATNYANLAAGNFPPYAAPPFTTKSPQDNPKAGAHLLWTLPYALRHGHHTATGDDAGGVSFPFVPDRWLVLRTQSAGDGSAPVLTAFVLQSDAVAPLPSQTTPQSQYPDPAGTLNPQLIGSLVPLAQWTGPAGTKPAFLRAVGPGDVSWAAAYDKIANVFAFYDPLPEPPGGTTVAYSYAVTGWYANPAIDPLATMPADIAGWLTALAAYNWAVGTNASAEDPGGTTADVQAAELAWTTWQSAHGLATMPFDPTKLTLPKQLADAITAWAAWQAANGVQNASPQPLPQQTLCHGVVMQIQWSGPNQSYPNNVPVPSQQQPLQIGVGYTAMEAIAAWLAAQAGGDPARAPKIEQALEAFRKGLLTQLATDPAGADARLHAAEFQGQAPASEWIVVRTPADASGGKVAPPKTPPQYGGQQTIPLTPGETTALTALNALQAQRDAAAAVLLSLQTELFALTFKNVIVPLTFPAQIQTQITNATTALSAQIPVVQGTVTGLDGQIATAQTALAATLGASYILRLVNSTAAAAPNDPVVVVTGARHDTKFAAPGVYDPEDRLVCRFTGETVTGIEIAWQGNSQTLAAADLLGQTTAGPIVLPAIPAAGLAIPKEAQDLWTELLLLDPGSAPFLATAFFAKAGITPGPGDVAKLAAAIVAQQQAPWKAAGGGTAAIQATAEVASGFAGVLPTWVGVSFQTQPWSPIYMDWKVSWFPTATDPDQPLAGWTLDTTDYTWNGTSIDQPPQPLVFFGRTVMSPKIAQDIGTALARFKPEKNPPWGEDVEKMLLAAAATMGTVDVMAQAMSGLTHQLVTRVVAPSPLTVGAGVANLLGNGPIGFQPTPGGDPTTSSPFFSIPAGHLQLLDLWVVDAFGQILKANPLQQPYIAPLVLARTVTTPAAVDPGASYVQIAPRIAQAAQLQLQLRDANDDAVASNSSDLTSPICGWVVPNHLDSSLMVYAADGTVQGAVIQVQTDANAGEPATGLRWDAPPGSSAPLGAPPNLANAHLQGFVAGLLAQGLLSGAQPYIDLLDHIDSALVPLTSLGPPDPNLSALLGVPLAVVRATLTLSLAGMPVYNQSWTDTGTSYVDAQGNYSPIPPPWLSLPFGVRIGDVHFRNNGVMGYFLGDDYSQFCAVYGSTGQTGAFRRALRERRVPRGHAARLMRESLSTRSGGSGYVVEGRLVDLTPDASTAAVTMLVDPRGVIPAVSGLLPLQTATLAPGPVSQATRNMTASFRVGPLLTDPRAISMPLPAQVRGNWSWVARTDVTSWGPDTTVTPHATVPQFGSTPLRLSEAWLTLSGALGKPEP